MSRPSRAALAAPAAAGLAGLAVAGLAAIQDGSRGAVSALLGTALVLGFLAGGLVPLLLVRGQQTSAALGAGVLLLNYSLRLALAVLVLRAAGRSGAVEPRWTALAVIAAALAWTAGQAVVALRTPDGPPGPDGAAHDPAGHGLPAPER